MKKIFWCRDNWVAEFQLPGYGVSSAQSSAERTSVISTTGSGNQCCCFGRSEVSRGIRLGSFDGEIGCDKDRVSSWIYSRGEGNGGKSYGPVFAMVEY